MIGRWQQLRQCHQRSTMWQKHVQPGFLFKQCAWTNGITSSHTHHRLTPIRTLTGNLESTRYFCGFQVAKAIIFHNYLIFVSTEKFNNKTYFNYYAWPTGIWTDIWSNQKPLISYFLEYPIALWSHWSLSHILHPQWQTKSTHNSIWQCREVLLAGSSRYWCIYLLNAGKKNHDYHCLRIKSNISPKIKVDVGAIKVIKWSLKVVQSSFKVMWHFEWKTFD